MLLQLFCAFLLVSALTSPALANDESTGLHPSTTTVAATEASSTSVRVEGAATRLPCLIGTYPADGRFRSATSGIEYLEIGSEVLPGATRPEAVPPWVDLGSIEGVLEDYAPPAHAKRVYRRRAPFSTFRDGIVARVYGPERILLSPTHVVTDSKQRLIIADGAGPAIHILDGLNSFRIVGGPQHRILRPNGLAVDADDNIYVADEERKLVLVYDRDGRFLQEIGVIHGESMFEHPTAIAVDRNAGHLLVLDSPHGQMIVLDHQGRVLRRVGGHRDLPVDVRFDHPTEVAVSENTIAVLDTLGTRVVVLDGAFNRVTEFQVASVNHSFQISGLGLALDRAGNVYVSGSANGVRVFNLEGKLIGSLQNDEVSKLMFSRPTGLWIDEADRMYVADTNHRRVQVFEIRK